MTISKAGSTYTFSGQDKLGYDSKFTWDVDTDLVEVITYTLNGKETTAPAGETITYTSNWIVVNGKGVQTDVIPEAGDVIDTDMLAITVDGGKPEYIRMAPPTPLRRRMAPPPPRSALTMWPMAMRAPP